MSSALIDIQNLRHSFVTSTGASVNALSGINFSMQRGQFVSFVGHSGAGKSTLLGILAGLIEPTSGHIVFSEPRRTLKVGYLFQKDAIFPWRNVESNLSYSDEIKGLEKEVRRQTAKELCELVGLDPGIYLSKFPKELSGGEARRVSLGMALSLHPTLLCLDEATSSLDWISRRRMQSVIQQVVARIGATTISATHDLEEATWLSDCVAILCKGTITHTIRINLPRPRTDLMRNCDEFKSILGDIADAMQQRNCEEFVAC